MTYIFHARGHPNLLATHKNTLEFTKDKDLSVNGDCIVGIDADFSLAELKRLAQKHNTLKMIITAGKNSDWLTFKANKDFSSNHELVLRLSEFPSDRTYGFRSTKSAKMIDRKLVDKLKDPKQEMTIEIEPALKCIIFDFDDTIESLKEAMDSTHERIAKKISQEYCVYEPTASKMLDEIDVEFSLKGMHSDPGLYDRHVWFPECFKRLGVKPSKDEIEKYVTLYWRFMIEGAKAMPHASEVLSELKEEYKIAVMSDSDGSKRLKAERLKSVGLMDFIDFFITSDDTKINKPDRIFYSMIFDKFKIKADACVMVGDKPEVDLKLAKTLGMTTVWMKHGRWAKSEGNTHFDYVDHEITDLRELITIVRQL